MTYKQFGCFLLIMSLSPAFADDAVEAVAPSGISFEKTPFIIMQDETLTINKMASSQFIDPHFSIDVDFHFKNTSSQDIARKIAFALPPVTCQMDVNTTWRGLENTGPNQQNDNGLKDFSATVDGNPVNFTIRREAMQGANNITNLLTQLNIPLNPCAIQNTQDNKPDPRYSTNLIKYHLLTSNNEPVWQENIYFEWQQTFPAGKVINIHHHYTPVSGEQVPSPYSVPELNGWFTENTPPLIAQWNRNPATLAQSNPLIVNKNNDLYGDNQTRLCLAPSWIRYRLTTGAYWNGGIGTFKLIIKDDNNAPFAVNQFYGNNQPQTSMTDNSSTYVLNNFTPTQDLLVVFLSLPQNQQDLKVCGM